MESDIRIIHKQEEEKKKKKKSVKCDPTVQNTPNTASSEITVAMTLVTVVLLKRREIT